MLNQYCRTLFRGAPALGAVATLMFLSACSSSNPPKPQQEFFETGSSPFSRSFTATSAQVCEAARRALLSQGYLTTATRPDSIDATRDFQPSSDKHITVEFHVVCTPGFDSDGTSVVYANAVQSGYALKKSDTSASVGFSVLGSLSLPIRSSSDSMVKVSSETIQAPGFYKQFFGYVDHYLSTIVKPVPAAVPMAPISATHLAGAAPVSGMPAQSPAGSPANAAANAATNSAASMVGPPATAATNAASSAAVADASNSAPSASAPALPTPTAAAATATDAAQHAQGTAAAQPASADKPSAPAAVPAKASAPEQTAAAANSSTVTSAASSNPTSNSPAQADAPPVTPSSSQAQPPSTGVDSPKPNALVPVADTTAADSTGAAPHAAPASTTAAAPTAAAATAAATTPPAATATASAATTQ